MLYWRVFGSGLCRCIAAASMDLPALYLKILFPVMIQIGELWRSGTLGYPFEPVHHESGGVDYRLSTCRVGRPPVEARSV
jgi:hypothetical protein